MPASSSSMASDSAALERLWTLAKSSSSLEEFTDHLQQPALTPNQNQIVEHDFGVSETSKSQTKNPPTISHPTSSVGKQPSSHSSINTPSVPQLTQELARTYSRDNILIVTWANLHFVDFAMNWASYIIAHGISNYLVGAMDQQTANILVAEGVNVFAMYSDGENSTGLTTDDFGWGSPTFHKMGRQKVDLATAFLSFGVDICLCDVDTVWINDPTEYFASLPEANILASSDALRSHLDAGDTGLELPEAIHSALNIGLLYFRHSKNTIAFTKAWADMLQADEKIWDQSAFNELALQGMSLSQLHTDNPRVVWGCNHSVAIGVLPVASFASGHTYFVQNLFEVKQVKPYAVHTTFQYGGTPGKRNRLREAMLWNDSPEYYYSESKSRFLAFDLSPPTIPADFAEWQDTDAMIDHHLQSMKEQLRELRDGLAIAVVLNRTVIMPKLTCFCDRYWAPVEQCRVPGALHTPLPFVCPLDHVLVPMHFTDNASPYNPPIEFREYSFLSNPRTPARLVDAAVRVEVAESVAEIKKGGHKGSSSSLVLPTNQNDAQLKQLLKPYEEEPLLMVSSVKDLFGGFVETSEQHAFMTRFRHILDFWCCRKVEKGKDGGWGYAKDFLDQW